MELSRNERTEGVGLMRRLRWNKVQVPGRSWYLWRTYDSKFLSSFFSLTDD